MPRKIVALTIAAARKSELAGAWLRLGFTLAGGVIALADGVTLDFFAPDDKAALGVEDLQARAFLDHCVARQGGAALVGFSGEADQFLSARPQFFGGSECLFLLAPARKAKAEVQANGALGVKAVVAVAEEPADHAELLTKLTGQREMLATSAGLELKLEGGARLDVLTPTAFAFRFGVAAPKNSGFRIAGLVFRVAQLAETEKRLQASGVETKMQAGRLLAGPGEGFGVAVAFEQD